MPERRAHQAGSSSAPDVEKIAKENPRVDVDRIREAQRLLEKLEKAGVTPQEYGITSPYERRPPSAWRRVGNDDRSAR